MGWLKQSLQSPLLSSWSATAYSDSETASTLLAGEHSTLDPWLSPSTRILVLGTLLPVSVLLLTLLYDVLSAIRWPKFCQAIMRAIRSPITDFMSLEDLDGERGPVLIPSPWRIRILVLLSSLEAVAWAAILAYELLAGDVEQICVIRAGVAFLTWVRAFLSSLHCLLY